MAENKQAAESMAHPLQLSFSLEFNSGIQTLGLGAQQPQLSLNTEFNSDI